MVDRLLVKACILLSALFIYTSQVYIVHASPVYPLKASADKKYLVDQNNVPVLINGDAPWEILNNETKANIDFYLQKRASQGVNTVIFSSPELFYVPGSNCINPDGQYCFSDLYNVSNPNPNYFTHTDYAINKAAEYGIQVLLSIYYVGCCGDGWYNILNDSRTTTTELRAFGTWIGNRYNNYNNIIYTVGGDRNHPQGSSERTKLAALAEGLHAADPDKLITFHTYNNNQARIEWSPTTYPWLTLNNTYVYDGDSVTTDPYTYALNAYYALPTLPFIMYESKYEGESNAPPVATTQSLREVAYQSILGGASGHIYGNRPVWPAENGWQQALDAPGATQLLPNIKKLFESREWWKLVPETDVNRTTHSVIVSGYGNNTIGIVPAARTNDGSTIIAYIPTSRAVTIDMTKISGSLVNAYWFNPRNGTSSLIGQYPNTGTRSFTPVDNNDWVLVLDDAGRNFPAPGTQSGNPTPTTTGPTNTPTPTSTPLPTPTTGPTSTPLPPSVTPTPVRNCGTLPGDANSDGKVTLADLSLVLANFGKTVLSTDCFNVVPDSKITLADLSLVLANFGSVQTTPTVVAAINAGGSAFTATDSTSFSLDQYFTTSQTYTVTTSIANTTDDTLYQTQRWDTDTFSYNIPVPTPGTYTVTLKFAELYWTEANRRQFHVDIEGTRVETNLDVFTQAGGINTALDKTYTASTSDTTLTITFSRGTQDPMINGVVVRR